MPEIVERNIGDIDPLFCGGRAFPLLEPLMNSRFAQTPSVQLPFWNRQRFALGGKHIGTLLGTPPGAQIVIERPARLVQKHNVAILPLLVADIELEPSARAAL